FAAWPPAPVRVRARTSSPGTSGCSSRTITSSITSPRVASCTGTIVPGIAFRDAAQPVRPGNTILSMEGDDRLRRARSFLIGGVVGASAALATARRRRELARRRRQRVLHPAGLAAFEGAPCYRELIEAEERAKDWLTPLLASHSRADPPVP